MIRMLCRFADGHVGINLPLDELPELLANPANQI
jgi:hypothetical protein